MRNNLLHYSWLVGAALALSSQAGAETIILKNGTFVEGKIIRTTSTSVRVETRFGPRSYNKRDIDQILEGGADSADGANSRFSELPPVVQAVLNAETDYRLGEYDSAFKRLEALGDYSENAAIRSRIDWLKIDIHMRQSKWETAKEAVKEKKEKGSPQEKIRAKAYLDILEVNPEYDLRYVGKKHARNFIRNEELRNRAREANSLKYDDIMRAALEEYCEQVLVEEKQSVKSFEKKLVPRDTYEACKKITPSGDVDKQLPYFTHLQASEAALAKARAILGEYGSAFELDLVRAELTHLLPIFERLLDELLNASPALMEPALDPQTGRLTAESREQWRQRSDAFLNQAKPVSRLIDYMAGKSEPYPNELRDVRRFVLDLDERLKQMINETKRNRDRKDA